MIGKIAAICLTLTLLVGCSAGDIYDNKERLVGKSDSYSTFNYSRTQSSLSATATIGKMDGARTIWSHNVRSAAEFDLTCTLTVDGGKAKLVLIYPDDALTTLVEVDTSLDSEADETFSETVTLPDGKARIKLVADGGESLNVNISATKHN